ncbi:MAG: hypothetical protein J6T01_02565 [Kiritimatiellae bacterium]|nr:hypothetical protein [Kiritimatiellia bacterium]
MAFEDGTYWRPLDPDKRGRYKTTSAALEAAFKDLLTEKNEFFDSLADNWKRMFPDLPARPGRYEDGKIFIYVKNAPTSFAVRPKLRGIAARLAKLPGAPKKVELRMEIHST